MSHLANIQKLRRLNLQGCRKITDAGLAHLAKLKQLRVLVLTDCGNIIDANIQSLKKALPNCRISK
ncbi:MAG: hypothetical protein K8S55_10055 [Phycisphaerae bacterium]|nr:hypothetical protein [Phycisphaerae bacterium]